MSNERKAGDPNSAQNWNATQRRDGTWASDDETNLRPTYDRAHPDDAVRQLEAEVARLTAALTEANERIAEFESIVGASPAVQKAMGRFHEGLSERRATEREAKAREEEREANASLWPCAPTMIGSTPEYEKGFVAGLTAFRTAIRARKP